MIDFSQYRVQAGFALLVAWLLWQNRGELGTWLAAAKGLVPSFSRSAAAVSSPGNIGLPTVELIVDEDTADFQALKRLQARFARQKCADGAAAVDTCLAHFFHSEG